MNFKIKNIASRAWSVWSSKTNYYGLNKDAQVRWEKMIIEICKLMNEEEKS